MLKFASARLKADPELLLEALDAHPFKLIVLLRSSPIVPFNVLNYYVGACRRFHASTVSVDQLAVKTAKATNLAASVT